ncbi:pyruvate dehydrogenase [acetyl-transferring]-phosphatase 1, mitochondrial-like [Haliotis rufescens]|uniref:pyruvate dehydrogenase [acetyl-transferring]-phosphatase 1, mitochondrial-like n=1 Tax=Haliotis rufescens TaxID=6454 RepID=UPI00201ED4E7|nr:pyruvate dehydrogenase [acetyl-transferring]-phosphatase 1, mitochondrial-like [Haliotis rufescens]
MYTRLKLVCSGCEFKWSKISRPTLSRCQKTRVWCYDIKNIGQISTRGTLNIGQIRWYTLRSFRGPDPVKFPRLTPQHVTAILQANETSVEETYGPVKGFETNQLQSNNPIEDRRGEARLLTSHSKWGVGGRYLFGMFDGHAGNSCAQSVRERLFHYIAVTLSSPEILHQIKDDKMNLDEELMHQYRSGLDYYNENLGAVQQRSLAKFASETLAVHGEEDTLVDNLTNAFVRLDQDICTEALPEQNSNLNFHCLQSAFSGAVGCVAFVDGLDLYIANAGDAQAVLGVNTHGDEWEAVALSNLHNADNESEVNRLFRHHPNESGNILKNGRLFGDLAPLRAFGDVRYKWASKDLKHIANTVRSPQSAISIYGNRLIPRNYHTPPYLTAEPEIIHHRLTPRDKFLVLASDGLWDTLSPEKVVQLVAGHLDGRQVWVNFHPPQGTTLKDINEMLKRRKSSLANITVDANVATHLIRNSLGPDHGQLSAQLTLPDSIVRFYRDDISVTVIYFDTDYIIDKASV